MRVSNTWKTGLLKVILKETSRMRENTSTRYGGTKMEKTLFEEQETVINYCKYHIGEWAEVYTTDRNVMRRYERFCEKNPEYGKIIKDDKYGMTFSVHPKCASLFPRAPRKNVISEERRQELIKRMTEIRNMR